MKWVLLVLVIGIVGDGFWFHQTHGDKAKQFEDQAKRDVAYAELKAAQAKLDILNKWVDACKNHDAPDKLDGAYDGFSYSKESDYVKQKDEQEQRYKDLQSRFDSAYGK